LVVIGRSPAVLPWAADGPCAKADGGQIDALSGATISSRGVCGAIVEAGEIYKKLKPTIIEKIKEKRG